MNTKQAILDKNVKYFIAILSLIVALGIIMVFSSSYIYAKETFGSSAYFFYRQLIYLSISVGLCFIVSKTKVSFWTKYGFVFQSLMMILLILTFVPGLSNKVNGASRWLVIGGFGLQPGEFSKYTILLACIPFFQKFNNLTRNEIIQYAIPVLGSLLVLVLQPDFGTFSICFIILAAACFLSEFPRKYFYSSLLVGIIGVIGILFAEPYRVKRLFTYLDPWKNPQTSGFQIIQSYLAFANGSIIGKGLGNSVEKLFYLPEAHNDFIFSVIGEELGFIGVLSMACLFLGLIYFGLRICLAMTTSTRFILSGTLVLAIGIQAFLNMGVVLGLLPTKGLNLPFVSSGGSSLLANFFAIGLILSCARAEKKEVSLYSSSYDRQQEDLFARKGESSFSTY
ncbi:putative lipid II flippase FtsW [Bacteriovoracaceae bacterium]|nr:putative lipid II flippase FtsW [Bacteriovoracaceae bacterium]